MRSSSSSGSPSGAYSLSPILCSSYFVPSLPPSSPLSFLLSKPTTPATLILTKPELTFEYFAANRGSISPTVSPHTSRLFGSTMRTSANTIFGNLNRRFFCGYFFALCVFFQHLFYFFFCTLTTALPTADSSSSPPSSSSSPLSTLSFANIHINDLKWSDVPRLLEEYQQMAKELEKIKNDRLG